MIESHHIKVERTAHYYTIGQPTSEVKYLVIACHGYGQLAEHFIRKFDILAQPDTLIVAPEGLSRFYWDGLTGKVASSWMTKADRLDEISDYAKYLNDLHQAYLQQLSGEVKTILFGFSQGCATVIRWPMEHFPTFDTLVLWGGMIPEDLDYIPHQAYWSAKKIYGIVGTQDQFITPERVEFHRNLIKTQKLEVEERTFEGGHVVDRDALLELFKDIRK
ncbi:MAG: phospholipase [Cyanothece sp. SIO1E1]|nr:phospholipase [Cyanothece sp. SIO1E1]